MNDYYINQPQVPFPFPGRGPFQPGYRGRPLQPGFDESPFGGTPETGQPTVPPPSFIPQRPIGAEQPGTFLVDPGAIVPCRNRFVYLWLTNGQQFWAWLTFVGPNSVAGWRWLGFGWTFFGTDLRNIDTFVCF